VWPTSAEDIEAAQPDFGGKPIGDLITVQFSRCGTGSRFTCVVDGDTIWYKGDRVRIADIDAPEVSKPECAREIAMGERATARLLELLNAAPFSLQTTDTEYDRYGRRLLKVTRNGKSLGDTLVREGLAERWGGPRINWCSR
jgi:endonuclease YncB( thermonuclease family)